MKVIIVKEVKRSDGLWRFACGDVLYLLEMFVFFNSLFFSFWWLVDNIYVACVLMSTLKMQTQSLILKYTAGPRAKMV